MLGRCTRWHMTFLVPNKEEETLMECIDQWGGVHGPPQDLKCDGEGGIVISEKCRFYFARTGIKLMPSAKDQHARFVELRGALLRDTIHRVKGQLRE